MHAYSPQENDEKTGQRKKVMNYRPRYTLTKTFLEVNREEAKELQSTNELKQPPYLEVKGASASIQKQTGCETGPKGPSQSTHTKKSTYTPNHRQLRDCVVPVQDGVERWT